MPRSGSVTHTTGITSTGTITITSPRPAHRGATAPTPTKKAPRKRKRTPDAECVPRVTLARKKRDAKRHDHSDDDDGDERKKQKELKRVRETKVSLTPLQKIRAMSKNKTPWSLTPIGLRVLVLTPGTDPYTRHIELDTPRGQMTLRRLVGSKTLLSPLSGDATRRMYTSDTSFDASRADVAASAAAAGVAITPVAMMPNEHLARAGPAHARTRGTAVVLSATSDGADASLPDDILPTQPHSWFKYIAP